jgi:hypothetical protein
MTWLIKLALGWSWPRWAAILFGWVSPLLALIGLCAAAYALIYHAGEKTGGAKVTAEVTRQHDQAVADSRQDERAVASTSSAIGTSVAEKNTAASNSATAAQETIHAQISALPSAPLGGVVPSAADTGVLDASLDTLVDRANRAAAAADTR